MILKYADAKNLPMAMMFETAYLETRHDGKYVGNYHNLGAENMKKIPTLLNNPDCIVRMKNNGRINAIVDLSTKKEKQTLVSIELEQIKQVNNKFNSYNLIITAFSAKSNYIEKIKNNNDILYEKNKKVELQGIDQLHKGLDDINNSTSTDTVTQSETTVNSYDMQDKPKFSLKENFDDKTDFTENINKVVAMNSVCDMKGTEFAKGQTDLVTQVSDYFDSLGNIVNSKYGNVVLNRTGVKSSVAHGIGRNKAVAFTAVPNVIKKGLIIDYKSSYKNRKYDTAVFAAPVSISNEEYFMAAVVTVNQQSNEYYLHEVALQKKEDNVSFKTGNSKSATPSDTKSSIYSLLNELQNVNSNNLQDKFSLKEDSEGNKLSDEQIKRYKNSI